MRSATSARARFLTMVATSKFKNLNTAHHDLTDALAEEKQVYLTMGDKISLYSGTPPPPPLSLLSFDACVLSLHNFTLTPSLIVV